MMDTFPNLYRINLCAAPQTLYSETFSNTCSIGIGELSCNTRHFLSGEKTPCASFRQQQIRTFR
ncbi:uncharacterized protein NMK_0870 [Novimethylophilus kurashikiensis]|uniref:Uncharacterized protein n=1 Tax=Novimethylophilus kurashikiensis TaxID=1825523 RepID=A0A2R5F9K7_9PROT|nr:uncharacterized protein NMK_0870 [Novimethylophilus kurashikiensis]